MPGGELMNPFIVLLALYVAWNIYHFGAQNFGLWRLWPGGGWRSLQNTLCVGGTVVGMVGVPIDFPVLPPIALWTFGLGHWFPAIGLAAKPAATPWHSGLR
jgi:hypothetical protein